MSEELFKPTLSEERATKTYDISKLYYVAFFGGVIPTVILGAKNARWLGIDKKKIILMIALGAIVLISQIIALKIFIAHPSDMDTRSNIKIISIIYQGASLLLSYIYYNLMQKNFKMHIMTGGETEPMLKEAIIWTIISTVIVSLIFIYIGVFKSYGF
ncbi:MAG: hypothetical protein GYA50_05285 [Eubacteriaceae bacterium]|nr:hypothetical protein [Eubacteriaceae bacterium]